MYSSLFIFSQGHMSWAWFLLLYKKDIYDLQNPSNWIFPVSCTFTSQNKFLQFSMTVYFFSVEFFNLLLLVQIVWKKFLEYQELKWDASILHYPDVICICTMYTVCKEHLKRSQVYSQDLWAKYHLYSFHIAYWQYVPQCLDYWLFSSLVIVEIERSRLL